MPTYNGSRFIRQTLDGLLSQTVENFELIISDNASTDDTEDICREYASRDGRIRYVRQSQNRGAAWNYNYVFRKAGGRYFKWSADDDLCAPTYLQECVSVLESDPDVVVAFTQAPHIDLNGDVTGNAELGFPVGGDEPHIRFRHLITVGHDCRPVFGLIRTDVLKTTPLIRGYVGSDRGLIAELTLRGRFVEIQEDLQFRRIHPRGTQRSYAGRASERLKWFDPSKANGMYLREWELLRSYLGGIMRSRLNATERVRCYKELLRWLRWGHGRVLMQELKAATLPSWFVRRESMASSET